MLAVTPDATTDLPLAFLTPGTFSLMEHQPADEKIDGCEVLDSGGDKVWDNSLHECAV